MTDPNPTPEPPVQAQKPATRRPGPAATAARLRQLHAGLAPFVLAPLLITVCTGMSYRLLRDWGGMGRDASHILMELHEGEWLKPWLGANAETLYVLLNGLGLLWMLISGAGLLWQRLRTRRS
jgi:hypothetical protein